MARAYLCVIVLMFSLPGPGVRAQTNSGAAEPNRQSTESNET